MAKPKRPTVKQLQDKIDELEAQQDKARRELRKAHEQLAWYRREARPPRPT